MISGSFPATPTTLARGQVQGCGATPKNARSFVAGELLTASTQGRGNKKERANENNGMGEEDVGEGGQLRKKRRELLMTRYGNERAAQKQKQLVCRCNRKTSFVHRSGSSALYTLLTFQRKITQPESRSDHAHTRLPCLTSNGIECLPVTCNRRKRHADYTKRHCTGCFT